MKTGKYKKQLQSTFFAIGICFVFVCGLLLCGLLLSVQRANYKSALQQTVAVKNDAVKVSMDVIFSSLRNLRQSEAGDNWGNYTSNSEYYFNSVQLKRQLQKTTANMAQVEYSIFVTLADEESFVISQEATIAKNQFFTSKVSGINEQQKAEIFAHFAEKDEPFSLACYQDEKLKYVYYIVKTKQSTIPLLYFVRVPAKALFGPAELLRYFIYDNKSMLAYSNTNEKDIKLFDNTFAFLRREKGHAFEPYAQFNNKGKDIYVIRAANIDWTIAYIYDYVRPSAWQILLFVLLPIAVATAIAIMLFKFITNKLYRPISEVISDVPKEPGNKQSIDEFQIIRNNIGDIASLSAQLESAITKNQSLAKQRYYRELLFGVPDMDCPLTADEMCANYCVALVEFQQNENCGSVDDWYIHLQKNYLYVYVQQLASSKGVYYASVSYNTSALIISANTFLDVNHILGGIYKIHGLTAAIKIAVSDMCPEVLYLQESYKKAQRIIEYRYLFTGDIILTQADVQKLDIQDYHYPLALENRLIQAVATGQVNALVLYDEIIYENFNSRAVLPEVYRNLFFALFGTLMRVFQEIKTTPQSLLGADIDIQSLYDSLRDLEATETLRGFFERTISAVQQKNATGDDELLARMQDFIYENYSDDIMLVDIAEAFGISPKYCSTLFKRLSNDNFKNFLNRYRVERAKEILEKRPNTKIADLSLKVGFNSSNSFIRVFSKYIGITPKVFAEKMIDKKKN